MFELFGCRQTLGSLILIVVSVIYRDQCILILYSLNTDNIHGYYFMLRSRNQTTNQIPRSYKNDGFDWPFDLVIVT